MPIHRPRRLYREPRERPRSFAALHATRLFLLSFAMLIAIGRAGFLALPGPYTGPGLGFVDALFPAASAVCGTGLVVVDTATYVRPPGQARIAIQLGWLGILTCHPGHRTAASEGEPRRHRGGRWARLRTLHLDPGQLVRYVLGATLVLEAAGAVGLWWSWKGDFGAAGALWPAPFPPRAAGVALTRR